MKSTADEQGAAAMTAKKIDDDYNGAPVQVWLWNDCDFYVKTLINEVQSRVEMFLFLF